MNFPKDIILTNSVRPDAFDALDSFKIHHFPMINIRPKDIKPFNLSDYDYFIFTSQNSVEIFFDYPFVRVQYEKQIKAICSGSKTEEKLRKLGATISFSSNSSYALDMIDELKELKFIKNSKVLVIVGSLSDTSKYDELKKYSRISILEIYKTEKNTYFNHHLDKILKKGNSISVFASPSSFAAFTSIYNSFNTEIYSIGETTSEYIKSQGFDVITSKEQTFDSLVNEIINNTYQL